MQFFTIGQRQGLEIGGKKEPYFVVGKKAEKNIVYVGMGKKHKLLYKKEVQLENIHLISKKQALENLTKTDNLSAAIRYRHKPVSCIIDKNLKVTFIENVRAVTPGQSLVFYKENQCLGGGVIKY